MLIYMYICIQIGQIYTHVYILMQISFSGQNHAQAWQTTSCHKLLSSVWRHSNRRIIARPSSISLVSYIDYLSWLRPVIKHTDRSDLDRIIARYQAARPKPVQAMCFISNLGFPFRIGQRHRKISA